MDIANFSGQNCLRRLKRANACLHRFQESAQSMQHAEVSYVACKKSWESPREYPMSYNYLLLQHNYLMRKVFECVIVPPLSLLFPLVNQTILAIEEGKTARDSSLRIVT